ncbi:hypothetical protein MAR_031079 [Mya arenaria]|uniref:Uncharacterized protein n=1 Tax=Mya arenaria TaxID=6604 RepID=A0ABY7F2U6_MYAAR|nr:hypothetical protein MAR_031079 [Mya arenaria]
MTLTLQKDMRTTLEILIRCKFRSANIGRSFLGSGCILTNANDMAKWMKFWEKRQQPECD